MTHSALATPSALTTSILDRPWQALARPLLWSPSMQVLFGYVDGMRDALTYHRERHTILAGNLANIDTPGYAPADLVRTGDAAEAALAVTHAGHLGADASGALAGAEVVQDAGPRRPDENSVSLERELAKVEANRLRYQATSELVNKRLALLRYTAGDGT